MATQEGERTLAEAGRYTELAALYRNHRRHRSALELLSRIGASAAAAAGPEGSGSGGGGGGARKGQFGPRAVVEYLLSMRPQDPELMLEFSAELLRNSPSEGLALFARANPPLPASRVLPHLKHVAPALCAPYLEMELTERGARHPAELHTALILLYLDSVCRERAAGGWDEGTFSPTRAKLVSRLADPSAAYSPERMLSRFPTDALLQERALLLSRLGRHTAALRIYVWRLGEPKLAEAYCETVFAAAATAAANANANVGTRTTAPGAAGIASGAGAPVASSTATAAAAASPAGPDSSAPVASGGFVVAPEPIEGECAAQNVFLALLRVYLGEGTAEADGLGASGLAPGAPAPAPMLDEALSLLLRCGDRIDGSQVMGLLPGTIGLGVRSDAILCICCCCWRALLCTDDSLRYRTPPFLLTHHVPNPSQSSGDDDFPSGASAHLARCAAHCGGRQEPPPGAAPAGAR